MAQGAGALVISLDFELYWGVRDKKTIESYRENLLGERQAVPGMLNLFRNYGVHATWATVGFLFFRTREELKKNIPTELPQYHRRGLSPYECLNQIGEGEEDDLFHYAPSMIELIQSYPHQEIGTHTFSHYYCLEPGQDRNTFREDLKAAVKTAENLYKIPIRSLVFPRNQFNEDYLQVCRDLGIHAYRGNQRSWVYKPVNGEEENLSRRAIRLLDNYFNLTGHHAHSWKTRASAPMDIPASRFLRPYSRKWRLFEPLRLSRILEGLDYAAKHDKIFHLWWHPHNFGKNLSENLDFLENILRHFSRLKKENGMRSLNMGEVSQEMMLMMRAS